jgi:hypothetical protein
MRQRFEALAPVFELGIDLGRVGRACRLHCASRIFGRSSTALPERRAGQTVCVGHAFAALLALYSNAVVFCPCSS